MANDKSDIGRFFKHSTIYAIGNIVNRLGAFLLLPVYTNYLTVAEYGALELFYATNAVISSLLSVGIAHATLRFYFDYKEQSDRNRVVSTNYLMSLGITTIGALVIGLFHEKLVVAIFQDATYSRAMLLILATLVLELSSQVCLAYLRALEKSLFFIVLVFAKLIIQISVNVYLVVVQHAGVEGVLTGNLVAVATGWLVLSVYVLRHCGLGFSKEMGIPVLRYSFPFLLSTMAGIVSINVDKFVISRLISFEAIGIYALAMKFALLLEQLVGEPFNRAYGAFRFSIMERSDASDLQANIVRYLMILSAMMSLGIVYFVPEVLKLISDKSFWGASSLLPLLVLASMLKLLNYPFQTGILVEKKTRHIFYTSLLAAVTSVVANIALIYHFGVIGACMAQVIVSLVLISATNILSQRYYRVHYEYLKLGWLLAVTAAFYLASLAVVTGDMLKDTAIKSLLYVVYAIVIYHAGLIKTQEKTSMRNLVVRYALPGIGKQG